MKKFTIGLASGIIFTLVVSYSAGLSMKSYLDSGIAASMETGAPAPDPLSYYKNDESQFEHPFRLQAEFLDPINSHIIHNNTLTLLRVEPALEFRAANFETVCVLSVDREFMNVGFDLAPETQASLAEELALRNSRYTYGQSSRKQRFIFEIDGKQLAWFWINDPGIIQYNRQLEIHSDDFDFVMQVPHSHLYDFQSHLRNNITDTPLAGCSEKVDFSNLPNWDELIKAKWDR